MIENKEAVVWLCKCGETDLPGFYCGVCKSDSVEYVPQSSLTALQVKLNTLVKASQEMLNAFEYLVTSDKTWQGKAKRKLETALKQFEEEK